jgi:hypothetical protein
MGISRARLAQIEDRRPAKSAGRVFQNSMLELPMKTIVCGSKVPGSLRALPGRIRARTRATKQGDRGSMPPWDKSINIINKSQAFAIGALPARSRALAEKVAGD